MNIWHTSLFQNVFSISIITACSFSNYNNWPSIQIINLFRINQFFNFIKAHSSNKKCTLIYICRIYENNMNYMVFSDLIDYTRQILSLCYAFPKV